MYALDYSAIKDIVARALEEDIGSGDITTTATVPSTEEIAAEIIARERFVVAGLRVAEAVFLHLDPTIKFEALVEEGEIAEPDNSIAAVRGRAQPILTAERTALNFLQRLCGVATLTRRFVDEVKGTDATILDTRKTVPGMRVLEKYAVAVGGGVNHRMGLYDRILIKDNHLEIQRRYGADAVGRSVSLAKGKNPDMPVEVEASSMDDVEAALKAGAEYILLDNMPVSEISEAVRIIDGRAITEASGGIDLDNVREVAMTGVQYISVGSLTHSARAVDLSLRVAD